MIALSTDNWGRDTHATDIDAYNVYVQNDVGDFGTEAIRPYAYDFRALVSTGDVLIKDNTQLHVDSSNRGISIHWLEGNRVANHYADFWDGSWDEEATGTFPDRSTRAFDRTTQSGNRPEWVVATGNLSDGRLGLNSQGNISFWGPWRRTVTTGSSGSSWGY